VSGFCIGFEREPDFKFYFEKCFYLHRLSVSPDYRGRGLGALLQTETIVGCFLRGFTTLGEPSDSIVLYGQTDISPQNRNARLFHQAAGFEEVGEKQYKYRTDAIMRMDAQSFWASRHLALWRRHRLGLSVLSTSSR
jgi:GNAT superfamily N-acetyltransferase